jgi:hypothetical protein
MESKTIVKGGLVAVIVAVMVWQGSDLFFGGGTEVAQEQQLKPNPDIPKPAALLPPAPPQPVMTEREMQLVKLQQELQAKYQAQVSELQMLRLEKEIAETNKDIQKAKLDTLTSQKDIVELLTPEKKPTTNPDTYAQNMAGGAAGAATTTTTTDDTTKTSDTPPEPFTVVSVSRIRGEWVAVLGYQGSLYNVKQGDAAPENLIVYSIDTTGVTLISKDGKKRKIAMISVI